MDFNDDSVLAESDDSQSDQESDESLESGSCQNQNNKIIILSAESLSSANGTKYVLPPELDLGSLNNAGMGKPVVIKAQPFSNTPNQYILLPESVSSPSCDKKSSEKRIRGSNVTPSEKKTLLKICEKYPVLNINLFNGETNRLKRNAWEKIHKEFIAICPDTESKDRDIKFLQGCFSRFKKEERKKARRKDEANKKLEGLGISRNVSLACDKSSTPPHVEAESQNAANCEETEHHSNISKACQLTARESCSEDSLVHETTASDPYPTPLNSDTDILLSTDKKVIKNGKTVHSISNIDHCSDNSVFHGTESAEFLTQKNPRLQLYSELHDKPLSIRSLRKRALELAVEVEKEKLDLLRYQKEAEKERLAAMKMQRAAQKYAFMVEKERYETELLKKEAAKRSLEKFL